MFRHIRNQTSLKCVFMRKPDLLAVLQKISNLSVYTLLHSCVHKFKLPCNIYQVLKLKKIESYRFKLHSPNASKRRLSSWMPVLNFERHCLRFQSIWQLIFLKWKSSMDGCHWRLRISRSEKPSYFGSLYRRLSLLNSRVNILKMLLSRIQSTTETIAILSQNVRKNNNHPNTIPLACKLAFNRSNTTIAFCIEEKKDKKNYVTPKIILKSAWYNYVNKAVLQLTESIS